MGGPKSGVTRTNSILFLTIFVLAILLGIVSYQYAKNGQVITTSSTVTSCIRVGEGWAFYIHVVDDTTRKPVSGVKINARTYVHCGGILDNTNKTSLIETGALYSLVTPNNGTVYLPTSTVDGYFFTVYYLGHIYPFETYLPPGLITNATLSVPSGNISITYYPPLH
jgi:hypothetical protein